jgi:hypothetical protein
MIWFAVIYLLAVWALTFPALWMRLLRAKPGREFSGMIYIWETLPALILISPALFLGYIVLWITEHLLRGLVIIGKAAWRAWLAIGRPAADLTSFIVSKLLADDTE